MLVHPVIAESCATALEPAAAPDPPDADLPLSALRDVDLLQRFAGVSDGRHDQGRDHPVGVVLVLCAAAVLGGMRSFTAIAGWVADVPVALLGVLYGRGGVDPAAADRQIPLFPSKTTLWRVLTGADPAAVNAAIGGWLLAQVSTQAARATEHTAVEPADAPAEQRGWGQTATPHPNRTVRRCSGSPWTAKPCAVRSAPTASRPTCWPRPPTANSWSWARSRSG